MYILIAILAGVSIVLSRIINFNLADKIGVLQGTLFNYIVGLIFSTIFLILSGEKLKSIGSLNGLPWWAYLGGALGVIVVALSTYITPKISAFYLTIFIFVGQLFVGGLIDYIILKQLSIGKIIGGALVLLGLIYNLILDSKESKSVKTS